MRMDDRSVERYGPVRDHESTDEYMTAGGTYTTTIWCEWSGLWAAFVTGPDGFSVCHGLRSREDAQAWSKAQAAAFAARADEKARGRQ